MKAKCQFWKPTFPLGLRKEDKKHQLSMKILELAEAGKVKKLAACGSAFVELGVGLRGSLKKPDIVEALRILRSRRSAGRFTELLRIMLHKTSVT